MCLKISSPHHCLRRCRLLRRSLRFRLPTRDSDTATSSSRSSRSLSSPGPPRMTTRQTVANRSLRPFIHPSTRAPTHWLMPLRLASQASSCCRVATQPHGTLSPSSTSGWTPVLLGSTRMRACRCTAFARASSRFPLTILPRPRRLLDYLPSRPRRRPAPGLRHPLPRPTRHRFRRTNHRLQMSRRRRQCRPRPCRPTRRHRPTHRGRRRVCSC